MIGIIIVSCLLIVCVIKWIFRDKKLYGFAETIPGPKAYPILGSTHKLLTLKSLKQSEEGSKNSPLDNFLCLTSVDVILSERFKIVEKILLKYGKNDMTRFWLGPVLFIFVNEPSLIKQVLNSPDCIEKSFTYKFLRLEKGLLAAKRKFYFIFKFANKTNLKSEKRLENHNFEAELKKKHKSI